MNYQFFIQGTDNGQPDQEFRFIMVLDTGDRDSLAQTSIQALITRHQMHTCVNIPFKYQSNHGMRFKTAYADIDGEPHPILVVISSRHGAFRLPFPAGEEGYRLFHKTYREVRLRLIAHRNRHLNRLSNKTASAPRLEAPQQEKTQGAKGGAKSKPEPAVSETRGRKMQTATTAKNRQSRPKNASSVTNRNWWKRQPESLRWLLGGLTVGLLVVSALFTSTAMAEENQIPTPDAEMLALEDHIGHLDGPFAGFPVPIIVEAQAAQVVEGCSIAEPFGSTENDLSIPGLSLQNRDI